MLPNNQTSYAFAAQEYKFKNKNTEENKMIKFEKTQLMKYGREIASLWGGECVDYEIDKENKVIIFICIEHGEDFVTSITFDEYEQWLNTEKSK
jgi:hypothetical protein